MNAPTIAGPKVWNSVRRWWKRQRESNSATLTMRQFAAILWEFVRESTPERKRRRYGDAEYDWEQRVNTTSGGVGARSRFLGLLNSDYQPIEADLFRDVMSRVEIDFARFTFIDIGSGKGRALLLAAEFPFRRIIGVELLPELHAIAAQNVAALTARENTHPAIETFCGDATQFSFPEEPLVVYLFNPLPEFSLRKLVRNLEASLLQSPRSAHVVYVNPVYEQAFLEDSQLRKYGGTHQYSLFRTSV
jgi:SAM-dependent methyltransferase